MDKSRYARTEQPALLTTPVLITLQGQVLSELNLYRQARHAYLSCPAGTPEVEVKRLRDILEYLGGEVAAALAADVQTSLGEPSDLE